MDTLTDKFKIGTYIDDHPKRHIALDMTNNDERVKEAIRWSTEHGLPIIIPAASMRDLENQWIDFNSMTKTNRRISDWKSIELFGFTNTDRYYTMRSEFLNKNDLKNELEEDIDQIIYASDIPVSESFIDHYLEEPYMDDDALSYSTIEVEKAKAWADETDKVIIVPTRTLTELEALWDAFNMMHHKHCRESDWKSTELFGLTNLKHYEYLKRQFLNNESSEKDHERYGSVVEAVSYEAIINRYYSSCFKTGSINSMIHNVLENCTANRGFYEDKIISNVVTSAMSDIGELSEVNPQLQFAYGDLPYYAPDDMIDMGVGCYLPSDNFYGVHADNTHINDKVTVQEWFEIFRAAYDGFYTEMGTLSADWVKKLRELTTGLKKIKESGDENAIKARMQSILELGWNPEVEFTDRSRKIARECAMDRMLHRSKPTKVIDLCEFRAPEVTKSVFNETVDGSPLKPIYIVLTQGSTTFSKTIMAVTNSSYSHASIAFDQSLSQLYSFTASTAPSSLRDFQGGFSIMDLKATNPAGKCAVFVFFVSSQIKEKIMTLIENLKNKMAETRYGYKNLFTLLFNIPYNNDLSMICSQFVDRCLKVAGIDITHKDSSLVTPEMLNKASSKNKYLYKLYDGIISKYNPEKVQSTLNSLFRTAAPLKESVYFRDEISYIAGICSNIDNIPVLQEMMHRVDLIKNPEIKRFVEEYVFDRVVLHPYCEVSDIDNSTTYKPSIDFIDKLIFDSYNIV